MTGAMGDLVPEQMRTQLGPMAAMITSMGGAVFGGQLGSALGSLAAEVLSRRRHRPAARPGRRRPPWSRPTSPRTARAWRSPRTSCASTWPCAKPPTSACSATCPWLRAHVLNAVESYARGITVDREAVENAIGRIDPTDPESMRELSIEGHLQRGRDARAEERTEPPRVRARPGRRLGQPRRRARVGGTACPTPTGWPRPSAAAAPPAARPSRPSPRWSGSNCARAACARPTAVWAALTEHRGHRRPGRDLGPPGPAARPTTISPTLRPSPRPPRKTSTSRSSGE